MNVEVYCVGVDGQILGGTEVEVVGECGRLLAPGSVDVPISVGGMFHRVTVRIPDADWSKDCPEQHRLEVKAGHTVTCKFTNRILATIA